MLSSSSVRQVSRFALSGLLITGLHFVIATLAVFLILLQPPLANAIAFLFATAFGYLINTTWSFSAPLGQRTLLRFIAVSFVGCFLAFFVASLAQYCGIHFLLGIALIAVSVPPATFLLHKFWTYR